MLSCLRLVCKFTWSSAALIVIRVSNSVAILTAPTSAKFSSVACSTSICVSLTCVGGASSESLPSLPVLILYSIILVTSGDGATGRRRLNGYDHTDDCTVQPKKWLKVAGLD